MLYAPCKKKITREKSSDSKGPKFKARKQLKKKSSNCRQNPGVPKKWKNIEGEIRQHLNSTVERERKPKPCEVTIGRHLNAKQFERETSPTM